MKIEKVTDKNIELKDIKIFITTPGTGKTYLGQQDQRYIDIDRLRSNYKYGREETIVNETAKGSKERIVVNIDYQEYTKKLISSNLNSDKILLLTPNSEIVDYINTLKEPYCLVYTSLPANEHMKERLRKRGNTEYFIQEMYGDEIAKIYYRENIEDQRPTYKIELSENEYLSTIMEEINDNKRSI